METKDHDSLAEIQQVTLDMAQYFVKFCNEHNLLCYLCGGGCIGAVRSKGLIPWDDDLDFFMPRQDYEKLKSLWPQKADTQKYPLLVASESYNDHNSFMTIRDAETTFIKTYQQSLDIPHGIPIDIFPLDGAPDTKRSRSLQKKWALVYALFCSQVVPEKHGGVLAQGSKFLLTVFRSSKSRYRIWKFAEKQMTKYPFGSTENVTELCVGPRYMGNVYELKMFESALFVDFEREQMPIPIGYNAYLTQVFGDYLKLPPEEERSPHHEAVYVDTKNPYTKYKGIYYCK